MSKSIEAFKRVLQVLGPMRYDVIHLGKPRYIKKGKSRHRLRLWGSCYYDEQLIEIHGFPNGYLDAIDTILHELLHAAYPELDEQATVNLTEEISAELWGAEGAIDASHRNQIRPGISGKGRSPNS